MNTSRTRVLLAVFALFLGGCSVPATTADQDLRTDFAVAKPDVDALPSPAAAPGSECANPLASYDPASAPTVGDAAPGSLLSTIAARGYLIVGVSADTLKMGARNPLTGSIEGFDIDVAHQISQAVFGNPNKIQFRVITSGQRIDYLTQNKVDLVARAFTITCDRWEKIAFSAEYYHAGQRVLVPITSKATKIEDLTGEKVCAPAGTTTLSRLDAISGIEPVPAQTHTECLAKFQEGEVDAISGDDTVLAGLAAQDPYAKVIGPKFSDEPYGLGINAKEVDFVRFVNGVLDDMKSNGRWTALYNTWLSVLGPAPAPPASQYGRAQ